MKNGVRYICFDTETTGTSYKRGHKVIEIGCVEIVNEQITDKTFQCYLNPEREIDKEAENVHGISTDFLKDKPLFSQIAHEFLAFIQNSVLVIHNAAFDIGFINNELSLANLPHIENEVIDTLILARKQFVGERASLDALCKRFEIDTSQRTMHGALLDSSLLAQVFLKLDSLMNVHLRKIRHIEDEIFVRENYNLIHHTILTDG